ncbi:hypothetical protein MD484_g533, partial [Candolleomyces efflorescens]
MKAAAALTAILAAVLPAALATDVTLWQLAEGTGAPNAIVSGLSVEISPVAVQTDGQTVYVAKEAKSLLVVTTAGFTSTLVATPTTNTFTFRADASRYHLALQTTTQGVKAERTDECNLREDGSLVCAVKLVAESGNQKATVAVTTTGSPTPWYTISNVESLNLPTQGSSASSITASLFGALVGLGVTVGVLLRNAMFKKAFAYTVAAALAIPAVLAADATLTMLEDVFPTGEVNIDSGTTLGASAIGVDQHGATIYAVSQVKSLLVFGDATTTTTVLSTPTTETFTYIADASRYAAIVATHRPSGVAAAIVETCQKQADGKLECGQAFAVSHSAVGEIVLATATTGNGVAFATVSNVESNLPTISIPYGFSGAPHLAVGYGAQVGIFLSAVGVLAGALLV